MSLNIKPKRPDAYDGKRDHMTVEAWIYSVESYLKLVQLGSTVAISDNDKMTFAATLFSGSAANWWFVVVQSNQVPETWIEFLSRIREEFVPFDAERLARDRLHSIKQVTSVVDFLNKFRNIILTIPGMTDGEKWDRFRMGLKPHVRLEVMKSGKTTFEEAARIALNVDSALCGVGMFSGQSQTGFRIPSSDGPVPMDIGNIERSRGSRTSGRKRRNNKCWVCKKEGCRSWKHSEDERKVSFNNVDMGNTADGSAGKSEN